MHTVDLSSEDIVEAIDGVYLAQLAAGENMSIQHYHITPGAEIPEHSHPHEQTGFVYEGTLTFLIDGEEYIVESGESYCIPGGESHGVINESDVPADGVDIFSPPRENPPWDEA